MTCGPPSLTLQQLLARWPLSGRWLAVDWRTFLRTFDPPSLTLQRLLARWPLSGRWPAVEGFNYRVRHWQLQLSDGEDGDDDDDSEFFF